jgi:hypothetical protein
MSPTSLGNKRGLVLNRKQAVDIYQYKIQLQSQCTAAGKTMRGQSRDVSLLFDISPKTVKDIWRHKTWKHATFHLWSEVAESVKNSVHDASIKSGVGEKV